MRSPLAAKITPALIGRILLMLAGIAIMGLGIDLVVNANLGNSPISATPYVASLAFPQVSFGAFMMIWQCVLVLTQIIILRKEFRLIDLMQIPVSLFFSVCIDLFAALLAEVHPDTYLTQLLLLALGIAVLGLGVSLTVISNTVMNCGEAVVKAVVWKTNIKFGTMKVVFDCTCVLLAVILSFVAMGQLEAVREGTVIAAATTGFVVNFIMAMYGRARTVLAKRKQEGPMVMDAADSDLDIA